MNIIMEHTVTTMVRIMVHLLSDPVHHRATEPHTKMQMPYHRTLEDTAPNNRCADILGAVPDNVSLSKMTRPDEVSDHRTICPHCRQSRTNNAERWKYTFFIHRTEIVSGRMRIQGIASVNRAILISFRDCSDLLTCCQRESIRFDVALRMFKSQSLLIARSPLPDAPLIQLLKSPWPVGLKQSR